MQTVILTDLLPTNQKPEWFKTLSREFQIWAEEHYDETHDLSYAQKLYFYIGRTNVPVKVVPMPSPAEGLSMKSPHIFYWANEQDRIMFHLRFGG